MNSKVKTIARRSAAASRQMGVSVMSVLLGLAISAAVVAVIYNQYNDSTRKARIESAQAEIVAMIASAQKLYGNTNQYGAVTTGIAVRSGVVPARLRIGNGQTAQNSYNGAIEFVPMNITPAAGMDSLTLTYGSVRGQDCQDLVLSSAPLLRRIEVGTTLVMPNDGALVIQDLADSCDQSAVDLKFTFGRGS